MGAYYLQPPDARAIILHHDLLCNDTCSVSGGGGITYWGGTNGKDPKKLNSLISNENNERTNFFSTQAGSEIVFDLESTCHVEL